MGRTMVAQRRFHSEEIAPGTRVEQLYPGGRRGPGDEVRNQEPGGQTWSDMVLIGARTDPFQMLVPDIRLPPNQYWPLHWHDCWTVVLIIEGSCCIGDWWMQPGDLLIVEPSLEYGPLLNGPDGCRMFEIFAKAHLAPGGYAPEYRDHPTLQGTGSAFFERSELNRRNEGRSILPCDGIPGVTKSRLGSGAIFDLGPSDDPDRGVMTDRRIVSGETRRGGVVDDWHATFVLDGTIEVAGRTLGRDDYLLISPGGALPTLTGGPDGAHLLELGRTAKGGAPRADATPQLAKVGA